MATGNHFRYVFTNDLYDSREKTFCRYLPATTKFSCKRRLNGGKKKEYLPISFVSTPNNGR
jgi:hypothetical protein